MSDECKHPRLTKVLNVGLDGGDSVYRCQQCKKMLKVELKPLKINVNYP